MKRGKTMSSIHDPKNDNNRVIVVDDEKDILQAYKDILWPSKSNPVRKSSRQIAAQIPTQIPITTTVSPTTSEEADTTENQFQIFCATSGPEALQIVQGELNAGRRIACGFFDVKMEGGMDGLQTLQEIWKLDPDLHATIVTAYHDRAVNDIDRLFGSRFKDQWDYLNKPFNQAEIVQKARHMLSAWNRKRHLEQTQAQLLQAERMATIGQLAQAVGHEFGNLLQMIIGQADLAIAQKDPEKIKRGLEVIIKAGQRASILTRNLKSFSRQPASRESSSSSTRAEVDLTQVIKETLVLVGRQFAKASIQVVEKTQNCSPIQANAMEIEQVLLNLIINAIHATPAGGKIEIGCKDTDEGNDKNVLFWVKDTGKGIPAEILPKIFDYAFTTKGENGSGLGLSISKSIIENHRGSMSVQTQVGQGTIFLVHLPRSQ